MIISSALKFNGKIYVGLRHHNCIRAAVVDTGIKPVIGEQGFITDDWKFLTRLEAAEHAFECGQVAEKITHPVGLFSEDLWSDRET